MTRNETFNGLRNFPIVGHYFELLETANPVDLVAYDEGGAVIHDERQVSTGFFLNRQGLKPFVRVEITTGASEAVKFMYSDALSGFKTSGVDIIDDAARRLGIVSGNSASAIANAAEVAVGVAEVAVLAAGATRKRVSFYAPPTNADDITLGATGITVATGCLVLRPGDFYTEETAAGAAWFAISGTAAQALRVQTAT